MHIYILGICGTFMGSLAVLAREAGFQVSGCDANVYPPMSTQLENAGIQLDQGFKPEYLNDDIDLVIVGNAMSRGNLMVEHVLDKGLKYTSGPQFLHDYILQDKWVLAVSGTHGKTTTASMLAFILEKAGMKPGFLIGGVVQDFEFSARLGDSIFFVVEADEYDTAFFDKRSKFVHYLPRTLIINNLEFDHADIFDDLAAIQKQFHHLLRIVPGNGRVLYPKNDANVASVLSQGLWSEAQSLGDAADWQAQLLAKDGSAFCVQSQKAPMPSGQVTVRWGLNGQHNVNNALAAIAAAAHVGVAPEVAAAALSEFAGVKRRMECLAKVNNIYVYDDFAHHPTAIATSLAGMKAKISDQGRVLAVIEPRSNTMRMGVHKDTLANAVIDADQSFWFLPDANWQLPESAGETFADIEQLLNALSKTAKEHDHIVIMSNGGFSGFHQRLISQLRQQYGE